jgi:hypothetical protein
VENLLWWVSAIRNAMLIAKRSRPPQKCANSPCSVRLIDNAFMAHHKDHTTTFQM